MSLWRQLTRGLRGLTSRTAADQDVADEVQQYLADATAALMATGLSREDAERAARLEFGNLTAVREQVRESGWENLLRIFFADLHYAARQLRKNSGFAATAILILALGIGASTAIFSAVNPILFQPLPYRHASRLMMIWEMRKGDPPLDVSFGSFHGLVQRSRSFDAMAVMKPWQPTMTSATQPERFEGQRVSARIFSNPGRGTCAGSGLRCRRRSVEWSQGRGPQRPALAATLRQRSHDCWSRN